MKTCIYKQAYDCKTLKDITADDQACGFVQTCCPECNGSGVYLLPDDTWQPCVMCKTSGRLWVTL